MRAYRKPVCGASAALVGVTNVARVHMKGKPGMKTYDSNGKKVLTRAAAMTALANGTVAPLHMADHPNYHVRTAAFKAAFSDGFWSDMDGVKLFADLCPNLFKRVTERARKENWARKERNEEIKSALEYNEVTYQLELASVEVYNANHKEQKPLPMKRDVPTPLHEWTSFDYAEEFALMNMLGFVFIRRDDVAKMLNEI